MASKLQGQLKARKKAIAEANRLRMPRDYNFTLEDKIRYLKGKIKNAKYDLENHFPGNEIIIKKIKNCEEELLKLEEELKGGNNEDGKHSSSKINVEEIPSI